MIEDQNKSNLPIFEQKQIRRIWHKGEWYWSVVDVIAILSDSPQPRVYWARLKERITTEGFNEALAKIEQLKLKSPDGRFRMTDTANRETLLRIIQSIPSPRAEPFRLWLARVGEERFEEIEHPEAALERVRATFGQRDTTRPGLMLALRMTSFGTNLPMSGRIVEQKRVWSSPYSPTNSVRGHSE